MIIYPHLSSDQTTQFFKPLMRPRVCHEIPLHSLARPSTRVRTLEFYSFWRYVWAWTFIAIKPMAAIININTIGWGNFTTVNSATVCPRIWRFDPNNSSCLALSIHVTTVCPLVRVFYSNGPGNVSSLILWGLSAFIFAPAFGFCHLISNRFFLLSLPPVFSGTCSMFVRVWVSLCMSK